MKLPKMTPRRWFWSLMAFGSLWCFAGWRWDPSQTSWMAKVQNGLSQPAETAAMPPSFILTSVQTSAQNQMRTLGGGNASSASRAELEAENIALRNENAQLKIIIMEYHAREVAYGLLKDAQIQPDDVVAATVVGYQAGAGPSILKLDKGAIHGIKENAVVVAPLEYVHVLGRVTHVGQVQCEVRLITDPLMKEQCQIIRSQVAANSPGPVQNARISPDTCMLDGLGNATMKIDNLNKQSPNDPLPGDLICLADGAWPAKVQHMVLGQVTAVNTRTDQPQRYAISAAPRITITAQRTVMILVRE